MASVRYDPVIGDKGYFPDYTLAAGNVVLSLDQINGAIFYHPATGANTVTLPPTSTLIRELQLAIGQAISFTLRNTGSSETTSTLTPGDGNTVFGPGSTSQSSVPGGSSTAFTLTCVEYTPPMIQIEAFAGNVEQDITDVTVIADDATQLTGDTFTISGGTTGMTTTISGTTLKFANSSLLTVPHGGTGVGTLTGVVLGNGTSPFTAESPLTVAHGGTGAATLTGILSGNGTGAVTGNAVTQYDVLVGGAANSIVSVGPGTAGQVLMSNGPGANPAYGNLSVPGGGTGASSLSGVVIGNGTSPFTAQDPLTVPHGGTGAATLTGVVLGNGTSALTADPVMANEVVVGGASNNTVASIPNGTAGWALKSNGPGVTPSFQPVGAVAFNAFSARGFGAPGVSGGNLAFASTVLFGGVNWNNVSGLYTAPATGNYLIILTLCWTFTTPLGIPGTPLPVASWVFTAPTLSVTGYYSPPNPNHQSATVYRETVTSTACWVATAGDALQIPISWVVDSPDPFNFALNNANYAESQTISLTILQLG